MSNNNALHKLEQYLVSIGAPVISRLEPGLSRQEAEELLRPFGVKNEAVFDLFTWKNGLKDAYNKTIDELELLPNMIMQSVQSTIEEYNAGDYSWKSGFFPIFFSGGGDHYLVSKENDDNRIYFSSMEAFFTDEPFTTYLSLEKLVDTTISCFGHKAYTLDSNKYYEVDFDLEGEIKSTLNPGCEV